MKGGCVYLLCLVVLNYNDSDTVIRFVESIIDYIAIDVIIVVDNCSTDNSYERLQNLKYEKIAVIRTKRNGGYGYGNNVGIKVAIEKYSADYIIICNPDVKFTEKVVISCRDFLIENPGAAVVSPMMLNAKKEKQEKCVWKVPSGRQYLLFSLLIGRYFFDIYYKSLNDNTNPYLEVGCVAGSMLMVNSRHMLNSGMYDERIFLYCEETVLGIKFKNAGLKSYLLLEESFIHYHSVSISKSINSIIKQKKIMWESRIYILEHYYNFNRFELFCANFIKYISLCEAKMLLLIRKYKKVD